MPSPSLATQSHQALQQALQSQDKPKYTLDDAVRAIDKVKDHLNKRNQQSTTAESPNNERSARGISTTALGPEYNYASASTSSTNASNASPVNVTHASASGLAVTLAPRVNTAGYSLTALEQQRTNKLRELEELNSTIDSVTKQRALEAEQRRAEREYASVISSINDINDPTRLANIAKHAIDRQLMIVQGLRNQQGELRNLQDEVSSK